MTTILFQGDSITDGARGRSEDPNHILGHGYVYLIGSKLGYEFAEQQPLIINRGVSGDRASDLYARWNEDTIALKPDIISLLVGANDAWRSMNGEPSGITDRFGRAYRILLEETREVLPNAKLILLEPFILKTGATEENWEQWQERIQLYQNLTKELADEFGALFVPLQNAFNEACSRAEANYWIWDGVHPTSAGHQIIAEQWLSVVRSSDLFHEGDQFKQV